MTNAETTPSAASVLACDHDAVREGRAGSFLGIADYGHDLVEMFVCACCGTSIGRVGIGPTTDFDAIMLKATEARSFPSAPVTPVGAPRLSSAVEIEQDYLEDGGQIWTCRSYGALREWAKHATALTLLVAVAAVTGCQGAVEPAAPTFAQPHQADELALVWHGLLEMDPAIAPPPITWVKGETCPGGNPMWPGIVNGGEGACAAGLFNNDYSGITLVLMPTWNETALAHELVHARCYMVHGDADDGHDHFPGEWAKVPVVNEAIAGDPL